MAYQQAHPTPEVLSSARVWLVYEPTGEAPWWIIPNNAAQKPTSEQVPLQAG